MSRPIGTDLPGYYRLHAPIYDLTRVWFLFGRERILRLLQQHWQAQASHAPRILEVGCGTGRNLRRLQTLFPTARLVGIDLAEAMLEQAEEALDARVQNRATAGLPGMQLVHGGLGEADLGGPFDIVLASYMLTMTGDAQAACLAAARELVVPGGLLGVVDFHATPVPLYARWMARNHVHFDPTLRQRLGADFSPLCSERKAAYGGLWEYFLSIDRRPG